MKKRQNDTELIPRKIENYVLLEHLSEDSVGRNYRAVEMLDEVPGKHKLITEIHPMHFKNPDEWTRINVLCDRIRHINNPNLYAPEKNVKSDDGTFFVFPFYSGKTLAQIVEDADKKEIPIPFELACSIALAIATMIEVGSSIVVKDQRAFHGFLTPDHIIIDYKGNIFLKCFGIWPLFDENESAVSEMTWKYGPWLAPEFIRKEKIIPQSDFYYLGYILYRMLTGNYFSYLPGEDFESTFTSISFVSDLPSTDIKFLTMLINFFKKTLNPNVNKRFVNIREFKNYILKFFPTPPEDFTHFKSGLSDYMNTLYSGTADEEEEKLAAELKQPIPETVAVTEENIQGELIDLPVRNSGFEKKPHPKFLTAILIIIVTVLAVGTYFLVQQLNKAKKEQQIAVQLLEKQNKARGEFEQKLQEVQKKLQTLDSQKTSNAEEKQRKDETISQLKKQEKELKKEVNARRLRPQKTANSSPPPSKKKDSGLKKVSPAAVISKPEDRQMDITKSGDETSSRLNGDEPQKVSKSSQTDSIASAPLVQPGELTEKPTRLTGNEPDFPSSMVKTYAGRRATVKARLLIDENGSVSQVEIADENKIPGDVRDVIIEALKKWTYKPPQKGNRRVKVWWPHKLKIHFKYEGI